MARPPEPHAARPQRTSVVRLAAGALLAIVTIIAVVVLVTWLAVQPRKLKYSVEQGSISGYNLTSGDHLSANFHFVVRASNPNHRMSVYYDRVDTTVRFQDQKLSVGGASPFYQPRRDVRHLELEMAASDVALYGAVAKDLRMERASEYVDLDLEIRARIRVKVGVFKVRRKLKVVCGSVAVAFRQAKGFERVFCDVDMD